MNEYETSSHVTEEEAGGSKECLRKENFYLREALREMRDHCKLLEEEIRDLQLAIKKERLSKIPMQHLSEVDKEEAKRFLMIKEVPYDAGKISVDNQSNREESTNTTGAFDSSGL